VSARVKVDEDLPRQVADVLSAGGHEAMTVREQGWQGISDTCLWQQIQNERRWLITADKGFADLRQHPPGSHAGVILLRSREENRRAYVDLAAAALERINLDEIAGALVVVTERGVRIRRAPIG
jgi:predicted nuclease of predicted toxin-antitoxin system